MNFNNNKVDHNLIRRLISESIENTKNVPLHTFLFETPNELGSEKKPDAVDLLISKLDKETLKSHVNINRKLI